MAKREAMTQVREPVADDLEPYRRLIEIQKQLVQMSKQHEQTRREFDALREQVAGELIELRRGKNGVPQRLRRSVAKLFAQFSRLATPERPLPTPQVKPGAPRKVGPASSLSRESQAGSLTHTNAPAYAKSH